jgi:hypothetical protein
VQAAIAELARRSRRVANLARSCIVPSPRGLARGFVTWPSLAWPLLFLCMDSLLLPLSGTALTESWMAVSIQVTTMVGTLLIVLLVLLLLGAVPRWSYNRSWGYGPSGLVGVVLLVILILVLTGRV